MIAVKPWPAGSACSEAAYPAFADALKMASYHFADDSGGEWGHAHKYMIRAAEVAANAGWPYWAIKRMYKEADPLPSFDSFMETYCKHLLAKAKGE